MGFDISERVKLRVKMRHRIWGAFSITGCATDADDTFLRITGKVPDSRVKELELDPLLFLQNIIADVFESRRQGLDVFRWALSRMTDLGKADEKERSQALEWLLDFLGRRATVVTDPEIHRIAETIIPILGGRNKMTPKRKRRRK